MAADDERLAVTIKTTFSGALVTAAFGVIAIEAALVVFVVDKWQDLTTFAAIAISAVVALVASAALGAKGIATVYKTGHTGAWAVDAGKGLFCRSGADRRFGPSPIGHFRLLRKSEAGTLEGAARLSSAQGQSSRA